jgi:hypothetical protein
MIRRKEDFSKLSMGFTSVILIMILEKEREDINGITDRSSKGNGNKERKMDLVYGDLQTVMLTKAIG